MTGEVKYPFSCKLQVFFKKIYGEKEAEKYSQGYC